ncbi:MAG TPA: anti-sigma factor domain-containing protein, partial [Sedimentibacter sp.]|nr:anti-sigma factor domain-containing protein [Sedimentibacter sp.]
MKAIIVEIKGNHAAILSDDGVVSKIRNKDYYIGQEIIINNNSGRLIRMTAAAAAAIMIFATPAWAYLTPYSYVSVDVDPSFEFFINRFDRVLTVRAYNDDGKELSKDINIDGLKNKEIQSAVRSVLIELKNEGYIIEGEEDGVIVAALSKSEKKTNMLSEKLRAAFYEEVTLKQTDTEIQANQNPGLEKPEKPE